MYELLREDAIQPLRQAVSRVKATPSANEGAYGGAIGIYNKVRAFQSGLYASSLTLLIGPHL